MRLAGCVAAVVCVVVMQWGTGACGAAAVGDVASWGPDRVASWLIDGGFGAVRVRSGLVVFAHVV